MKKASITKMIALMLCSCVVMGTFSGCSRYKRTEDVEADIPVEMSVDESEKADHGSWKDKLKPEPKIVEKTADELLQETVDAYIATMTLEEKIDQMFVVTPENIVGVDVATAAGPATQAAIQSHPVGGFIYMGQNLENPTQTREMLSATDSYFKDTTDLPGFLCTDEEGGTVARVAGNPNFGIPNVGDMQVVGYSEDPEAAYQVGLTIGEYLTDLGFNLDLGPDADVITNPENTVVMRRSFGTDAQMVSDMVVRELDGFEERGLLGCVKHFPGHGCTSGDTHAGYAYTNKTKDEIWDNELLPFRAAVDAEVPFIMVSHISLPNVTGDDTPSTLSKVVITDILRDEMGYDGIVMTDSLNMGAIVDSYGLGTAAAMTVEAGSDILLLASGYTTCYDGILSAVNAGTISEERIDASMQRIIRQKMKMLNPAEYNALIDELGVERTKTE